MNNRIVGLGVTLLLVAVFFAGCANEEPSTTGASETPGAGTITPIPSPTPIDSDREEGSSAYFPEVARINVVDVKEKLDAGSNMVIIDTRSMRKYEESHIAGAISVIPSDMAAFYDELDGYDEIITYCD